MAVNVVDPGFARFLVHDVTLLTPGEATDRYGNVVADWSAPTGVHERGWFTRESSSEMADGREAITSDFELSLAATSTITASMRVRRLGVVYEIVGDIDRAETPTGTHHLIARLRSVRG